MFRAVQTVRADDGSVAVTLRSDLDDNSLGAGDVTIAVQWSGINYKDGLAMAGNRGVMRTTPLIPGIDLVGTITAIDEVGASAVIDGAGTGTAGPFAVGDAVLVTGNGIGETHNGGLSERARVTRDWLVPLPAGLTARRAAAIGTAGFTAALSVLALERGGIGASSGEILVTGATGGVGSIAVALLAAAGHRVIASTGRPEHREYLLGLGAADIISRSELETPGRPLQSQRWAGAIDSVGGQTLANVLAQTRHGGTVAACGLVGGVDIPTTVMPFILRGVTLAGINSVECPMPLRLEVWARLARDLDLNLIDSLTTVVTLAEAPAAGARILAGELHGRTAVDVRA